MLKINVALPNGHTELLTFLPSSTVQDVRTKAQLAFGKKHLRLITAKNRVLVDFEQTLEEAEIEDGECLTALVLQPQLAATYSAFALWCHGDSAVVTWGDADLGGDTSSVQDQLKGVQQIQATGEAFAAILEDGSVVTWGRCSLWWRQFGSWRSAQGCEADSSHAWGLCCNSGRWIRRDLGSCRPWRWQFGSARSAQGCYADSSHMVGPLLRFWKMDPLWPGVVHALAVTIRQFKISWRVLCRFKPQV